MQHYKLVIFDWDGTVMDSVARIVSSMQATARDLSLTIPSTQQVREIIGLSLPTAADILFPGASEQQYQDISLRYKAHYKEIDTTPTPLFDNAVNLLEQLTQQDKLLAVATGKGRDGLERVWQMTDTKDFFHSSRCAYECQSKPHPEMLQQILAELNVAPEQAVMIGDTTHDMAMAQNANVDRIGVTYGVHDKAALAQFQPKAIVNSLFELQDLLL